MRVASLFAGVGGIDLAFEQAGFQIVWANEFDKDACNTYRLNFPNITLVEEDIRKIVAEGIPDFEVLTAGFPCQPFSVCGKKKGFNDERGNLFFEICRIIDAKKPKIVFLENVANLIDHDDGHTFQVIHNELASRGYNIRYSVVDACDYGVPQHRTRTYIVCFKDKRQCDKFVFPEKTGINFHITDIIDRHKKAEDNLYLFPGTYKYEKLNKAIDDVEQLYRISDYGVQKSKDGISFTLKANAGTWYDREPIIKDDFGIRKLSPYECFMLQGFPKNFRLDGILGKSAYKQAGNTVCVPVVTEIAKEILKVFEPKRTKYVLIGPTKSEQQLDMCIDNTFYYMPVSKLSIATENIDYILLVSNKKTLDGATITYIGSICECKRIPRFQISEIPKDDDEMYFRFNVDGWTPIVTDSLKLKWFSIHMLSELL